MAEWFSSWVTPSLKHLVVTGYCDPTLFLEKFLKSNGQCLQTLCFQETKADCLPQMIGSYCPNLSTILFSLFTINPTLFIPREPLTLVIPSLSLSGKDDIFSVMLDVLLDIMCNEDFLRKRSSTIRFKYISWDRMCVHYGSIMEKLLKSGKIQSWNLLDKDGVRLEEYLDLTYEGLTVDSDSNIRSSKAEVEVKEL